MLTSMTLRVSNGLLLKVELLLVDILNSQLLPAWLISLSDNGSLLCMNYTHLVIFHAF